MFEIFRIKDNNDDCIDIETETSMSNILISFMIDVNVR